MHIGDHYCSWCYVLLTYVKNALTCFIFYEVQYCNLGVATMKAENPPYLWKSIHHVKFGKSNISLIHFNYGWQN